MAVCQRSWEGGHIKLGCHLSSVAGQQNPMSQCPANFSALRSNCRLISVRESTRQPAYKGYSACKSQIHRVGSQKVSFLSIEKSKKVMIEAAGDARRCCVSLRSKGLGGIKGTCQTKQKAMIHAEKKKKNSLCKILLFTCDATNRFKSIISVCECCQVSKNDACNGFLLLTLLSCALNCVFMCCVKEGLR